MLFLCVKSPARKKDTGINQLNGTTKPHMCWLVISNLHQLAPRGCCCILVTALLAQVLGGMLRMLRQLILRCNPNMQACVN